MFLSYFKRMVFFSGVQAELKAQHPDQDFVNRVCQTDASKNLILAEFFPNQDIIAGPKKMKYFVVVCEVLSQRLALGDVSANDQLLCAKLLQDRYNKLVSDPQILATVINSAAKWRDQIELFSTMMVKQ